MIKFSIGENVMIIGGEEEGNVAVISDITLRSNLPGGTRYKVCTLNYPEGFLINEAKLDMILDSQIPLLEAAAEQSHLFTEMAHVKGGFNSIKLGVFEDETGDIPHFHFYKGLKPEGGIPKNARTSGGCICFMSPNYFLHAGHKETMDKKEMKGLIEFLNKDHESISGITNWIYMISLWNDNNPLRKQVPINTKIPAYTHNMESIKDNK